MRSSAGHVQRGCFLVLLLIAFTNCGSLLDEVDRIQRRHDAAAHRPACNPPDLGSVSPVYPGFANWLQYVRNDGTSFFTATAASCSLTATEGHYNSCIHSGELRRVPVTNRSDCTGLTASDTLGAFQWTCVMIAGVPNIVSGGLADEKFLSDLIDFAGPGSWRPNSVTVTDSCGSRTTAQTAWHTNNITDISAVVTPTISISTSGVIHVATSNPNRPIDITANHTAFVTQPGVVLTTSATGTHVSLSGNFIWLEVAANSANASTWSVNAQGGRFCHVRGSKFANQSAIFNSECRVGYSRFHNSLVSFEGVHRLFMHDVTFANSRIYHDGAASHNNIFLNSTSMAVDYSFSTGNGIVHQGNALINHSGANATVSGVRGDVSGFRDSTFMNVLYANAAGADFGNDGPRNTIINLAAAHGGTAVSAAGANNYFTGLIKVGSATTLCSGGPSAGISNACAPNQASDFTITNTLNLSTSLLNKVTTDDIANTDDTNGLRAFAGMTDFFRFENRYRGWGRENASLPYVAGHQGGCNAGNCRIWDLRPMASDTQVLGVLPQPNGNDFYIHRWNAGSLAACQAIRGAVWQDAICSLPGRMDTTSCTAAGGTWQTNLCSTRALRNAYEILNDGIGNDNGLCESSEHCVYTINIGSYQGHGPLQPIGSIVDGAVTSVRLWRYRDNGA